MEDRISKKEDIQRTDGHLAWEYIKSQTVSDLF